MWKCGRILSRDNRPIRLYAANVWCTADEQRLKLKINCQCTCRLQITASGEVPHNVKQLETVSKVKGTFKIMALYYIIILCDDQIKMSYYVVLFLHLTADVSKPKLINKGMLCCEGRLKDFISFCCALKMFQCVMCTNTVHAHSSHSPLRLLLQLDNIPNNAHVINGNAVSLPEQPTLFSTMQLS